MNLLINIIIIITLYLFHFSLLLFLAHSCTFLWSQLFIHEYTTHPGSKLNFLASRWKKLLAKQIFYWPKNASYFCSLLSLVFSTSSWRHLWFSINIIIVCSNNKRNINCMQTVFSLCDGGLVWTSNRLMVAIIYRLRALNWLFSPVINGTWTIPHFFSLFSTVS